MLIEKNIIPSFKYETLTTIKSLTIKQKINGENIKFIFVNQSMKEMTLDDLKLICDKANIPFKNQNIGGLLNDLQIKYFKPKRQHITEK